MRECRAILHLHTTMRILSSDKNIFPYRNSKTFNSELVRIKEAELVTSYLEFNYVIRHEIKSIWGQFLAY